MVPGCCTTLCSDRGSPVSVMWQHEGAHLVDSACNHCHRNIFCTLVRSLASCHFLLSPQLMVQGSFISRQARILTKRGHPGGKGQTEH